ncbi:MAG: exosortase U, partial [Planctomycetales bacterium]
EADSSDEEFAWSAASAKKQTQQDAEDPSGQEIAAATPYMLPKTQQALWKSVAVMFWLVAGVQLAGILQYNMYDVEGFEKGDPLQGDLRDVLPSYLDGWTLEAFEKQERGSEFLEANHTSAWIYRQGGRVLRVFMHRPYRNWHYLEVCYEGGGWQVRNLENRETPGNQDRLEGMHDISFLVQREDSPSQALAYTMIDYRNGKPISPEYRQASNSLRVRGKALRRLIGRPDATRQIVGVVVMMESNRGRSAEDRRDSQVLLEKVTDRLLQRINQQQPSASR